MLEKLEEQEIGYLQREKVLNFYEYKNKDPLGIIDDSNDIYYTLFDTNGQLHKKYHTIYQNNEYNTLSSISMIDINFDPILVLKILHNKITIDELYKGKEYLKQLIDGRIKKRKKYIAQHFTTFVECWNTINTIQNLLQNSNSSIYQTQFQILINEIKKIYKELLILYEPFIQNCSKIQRLNIAKKIMQRYQYITYLPVNMRKIVLFLQNSISLPNRIQLEQIEYNVQRLQSIILPELNSNNNIVFNSYIQCSKELSYTIQHILLQYFFYPLSNIVSKSIIKTLTVFNPCIVNNLFTTLFLRSIVSNITLLYRIFSLYTVCTSSLSSFSIHSVDYDTIEDNGTNDPFYKLKKLQYIGILQQYHRNKACSCYEIPSILCNEFINLSHDWWKIYINQEKQLLNMCSKIFYKYIITNKLLQESSNIDIWFVSSIQYVLSLHSNNILPLIQEWSVQNIIDIDNELFYLKQKEYILQITFFLHIVFLPLNGIYYNKLLSLYYMINDPYIKYKFNFLIDIDNNNKSVSYTIIQKHYHILCKLLENTIERLRYNDLKIKRQDIKNNDIDKQIKKITNLFNPIFILYKDILFYIISQTFYNTIERIKVLHTIQLPLYSIDINDVGSFLHGIIKEATNKKSKESIFADDDDTIQLNERCKTFFGITSNDLLQEYFYSIAYNKIKDDTIISDLFINVLCYINYDNDNTTTNAVNIDTKNAVNIDTKIHLKDIIRTIELNIIDEEFIKNNKIIQEYPQYNIKDVIGMLQKYNVIDILKQLQQNDDYVNTVFSNIIKDWIEQNSKKYLNTTTHNTNDTITVSKNITLYPQQFIYIQQLELFSILTQCLPKQTLSWFFTCAKDTIVLLMVSFLNGYISRLDKNALNSINSNMIDSIEKELCKGLCNTVSIDENKNDNDNDSDSDNDSGDDNDSDKEYDNDTINKKISNELLLLSMNDLIFTVRHILPMVWKVQSKLLGKGDKNIYYMQYIKTHEILYKLINKYIQIKNMKFYTILEKNILYDKKIVQNTSCEYIHVSEYIYDLQHEQLIIFKDTCMLVNIPFVLQNNQIESVDINTTTLQEKIITKIIETLFNNFLIIIKKLLLISPKYAKILSFEISQQRLSLIKQQTPNTYKIYTIIMNLQKSYYIQYYKYINIDNEMLQQSVMKSTISLNDTEDMVLKQKYALNNYPKILLIEKNEQEKVSTIDFNFTAKDMIYCKNFQKENEELLAILNSDYINTTLSNDIDSNAIADDIK